MFKEVLAPLVEADGGGVELVEVGENLVKVRVSGSYCGCPSVPALLSGVIEPAVKRVLGSGARVELVL